jgi:hypothetical protein
LSEFCGRRILVSAFQAQGQVALGRGTACRNGKDSGYLSAGTSIRRARIASIHSVPQRCDDQCLYRPGSSTTSLHAQLHDLHFPQKAKRKAYDDTLNRTGVSLSRQPLQLALRDFELTLRLGGGSVENFHPWRTTHWKSLPQEEDPILSRKATQTYLRELQDSGLRTCLDLLHYAV